MSDFNRRKFLENSAGIAAMAGAGSMLSLPAYAQSLSFKPEKDAKLRVLADHLLT